MEIRRYRSELVQIAIFCVGMGIFVMSSFIIAIAPNPETYWHFFIVTFFFAILSFPFCISGGLSIAVKQGKYSIEYKGRVQQARYFIVIGATLLTLIGIVFMVSVFIRTQTLDTLIWLVISALVISITILLIGIIRLALYINKKPEGIL